MSTDHKSVCERKNYELLYERHSKVLINYVYYKCGDMAVAEDIAQEAYIKLWENCARIVFDKALFFLKKISKNAFYNLKRHEKIVLNYKSSVSTAGVNAGHEHPHFILEEKEFADKVKNTIAQLPGKEREVFLLNRIDNLKYHEIAELMEISVKTVEKHMSRALKTIRKEIGNV